MGNKTVTFETKCYENDWDLLLKTKRLEKMISYCNYAFDKKILFINNVNDLNKVKHHADQCIKKGIIDEYYVVDEFANEALSFFGIEKDSFKGGYYYSIAELTGIYLSKTDYLLNFSSDSIMRKNSANWVHEAIKLMEKDENLFVANPLWNNNFDGAKNRSLYEDDQFFYGYGFSDQCYLIKTADFRRQIYSEYNNASNRYPEHGSESFEKKVDSYMRNHSLLRLTNKDCTYFHNNFPKQILARIIKKMAMNIYGQ